MLPFQRLTPYTGFQTFYLLCTSSITNQQPGDTVLYCSTPDLTFLCPGKHPIVTKWCWVRLLWAAALTQLIFFPYTHSFHLLFFFFLIQWKLVYVTATSWNRVWIGTCRHCGVSVWTKDCIGLLMGKVGMYFEPLSLLSVQKLKTSLLCLTQCIVNSTLGWEWSHEESCKSTVHQKNSFWDLLWTWTRAWI